MSETTATALAITEDARPVVGRRAWLFSSIPAHTLEHEMRVIDWLLLTILIAATAGVLLFSRGAAYLFLVFWVLPLGWAILTRRRRLERRADLGDLDATSARNVSKWFWVGPGPGGPGGF